MYVCMYLFWGGCLDLHKIFNTSNLISFLEYSSSLLLPLPVCALYILSHLLTLPHLFSPLLCLPLPCPNIAPSYRSSFSVLLTRIYLLKRPMLLSKGIIKYTAL